MKRAFWYTILALAIGAALRLFFILKFPAGAGDTVIYDQLASNWLAHGKYAMDVSGEPLSVDIRMPGYPAYLALVALLTRQAPENAHLAAMIGQILVDLSTCLVVASLAVALLRNWAPQFAGPGSSVRDRVFFAALWLAVLCPFTANYVAVPLTETWAIFFTAAATLVIVPLLLGVHGPWLYPDERWRAQSRRIFLAGLLVGLGTLVRPEAPLLLVTALFVIAPFLLRARKFWRLIKIACLFVLGAAVPLIPWTIRNAVTLHEFQPLTPKDANLPGELVPRGFMAWEATWLYRVRDNYLVPWKLNGEQINLDDIPASAFDTPAERERISAALEAYNQDLTLTPEEDAVFAQVARERSSRNPLRTYLWIPIRRAFRIWFTPRIELIPVSGHVFPLAYMFQEDPVDQRTTVLFFLLNLFYLAAGLCGAWLVWRRSATRAPVAFLLLYIFLRTAFLTTLETPEPRYVLVCFPALMALAAQLFGLRRTRS